MSQITSRVSSDSLSEQTFSAPPLGPLHLGGKISDVREFNADSQKALTWRGELLEDIIKGVGRRWARERRRRKVGRAYDMALEIARVIPSGSEVLDIGCGNGFIAHHLSTMLGTNVMGIDVANTTEAPIDYRRYDGAQFPMTDYSFDAVLLCYVLHHAQDVSVVLNEMRRVLRDGGLAIIYEDIPRSSWDRGVCWIHNRRWRGRTGPCTFRSASQWRALFESFGFEIASERQLSRWRNLTHPVSRRLYVLRCAADYSCPFGSTACKSA